jgi:hypothetical protein
MKPKVIAYYLPQYHPFKENDEWWGKGFTEWTNVARAKPLYKGHDQPKIPADLGFYDLRLPIVREQQVELAREAGIYGFCYWHYWFGNGKQLMADVFDEVLASGKPDFPFCLGWANHSWYAKNWNTNDASKDRLLIEQTYPGDDDIRMHYEYVRKAFKDPRYIMQDGKPIFTLFAPHLLPKNYKLIELWNQWAKEDGFNDGIYFIASYTPTYMDELDGEDWINKGFSAVIPARLYKHLLNKKGGHFYQSFAWFFNRIVAQMIFQQKYEYKDVYPFFAHKEADEKEYVIPTLIPNFDHSPRSKMNGYILNNSNPKYFKKLCERIFDNVKGKDNKLVWLRSWNEWGEGNYMEPDLKFGHGFINALKEAMNEVE